MPDSAPLVKTLTADLGPSAAGVTTAQPVSEAPYAGTVTSVSYTPRGAQAGANAPDTRTLTLVNKAQDGSGATVVATLALVAGVNLVANDEKQLTLSVVGGATVVAVGDILSFASTFAGAGIADPGGEVQVEITRS